MKNETSVMAILAAALGALCSYASALVVPLAVLIAVMLADYASGMAKAWSAGKLCSKTGLRGILKKLGYLVLVGVAGVVDWLVRYGLTQVGGGGQLSVPDGGDGHRLAHHQRIDLHPGKRGSAGRPGAGLFTQTVDATESRRRNKSRGGGQKCRSMKLPISGRAS